MASPPPTVKIRPARFPEDKDAVSTLFLAYEQFILDFAAINLDFQGFAHELASLPGKYSEEKNGALFLAYLQVPPSDGQSAVVERPIGCVGLRAFKEGSAELKRLYLAPESRGLGVGTMLVDAVVKKARDAGYVEILLDSLSSMTAARALYVKCGFEQIDKYYESVDDAVFYRLRL